MIFFVLIALLIAGSYSLYIKKRYQESKDKKRFMKEHFYSSNLWVLLVVLIPLTLVNLIFEEGEGGAMNSEYLEEELDLDSLYLLQDQELANPDFHYSLVTAFYDEYKGHVRMEPFLLEYYDELEDEGLEDLALLFRGFYFLKKDNTDSVFALLKSIENQQLKYFNLFAGIAHFHKDNDSTGFHFLSEEILNPAGAKEEAFDMLTKYLQESEAAPAMLQALALPEAARAIPIDVQRRVVYLNGKFGSYARIVVRKVVAATDPVEMIAAGLILLTWLVYIIKLAFFKPVSIVSVVAILILTIICTPLTFLLHDYLQYNVGWLNEITSHGRLFLYSVFRIGALEELVKIFPVLFFISFRRNPIEPIHYIIFASAAALGFAFLENLLYFDDNYGFIIHGRALTAVVGHMIFSTIFVYGFMLSRHKASNLHQFLLVPLFWLLSAIAHGIYDYLLFAELYLFFYMFFFLILRVWIAMITNANNQSPGFTYKVDFNVRRIQFYLAISLTGILMFEYFLVALNMGTIAANESFWLAVWSGSLLIAFIGSKLSSINLIKGYWSKINFSINPFTDDLIPQNFVGEQIKILPYYEDQGLAEYFPDGVKARIVLRQVLQRRAPSFFLANDDPEWFLVKFESELAHPGFKKSYGLIKFYDVRASLNDKKFFQCSFLLIPKEATFKDRTPYRKEMESLGWVWIEGRPFEN